MATSKTQCLSVHLRGNINYPELKTPIDLKYINLYEGKWQIAVKSIVVEFQSQANKAVSISSTLVQQYHFSQSRAESILSPVNLKVFKLYSNSKPSNFFTSSTRHVEVINCSTNWFNITHPQGEITCFLQDAFGGPLQNESDHLISIEFYLRRIK